jgi:hypothetical protein
VPAKCLGENVGSAEEGRASFQDVFQNIQSAVIHEAKASQESHAILPREFDLSSTVAVLSGTAGPEFHLR